MAPNKHIDNVALQTQPEERGPKSAKAPWEGRRRRRAREGLSLSGRVRSRA